jgi:hypothetical protein
MVIHIIELFMVTDRQLQKILTDAIMKKSGAVLIHNMVEIVDWARNCIAIQQISGL